MYAVHIMAKNMKGRENYCIRKELIELFPSHRTEKEEEIKRNIKEKETI